MSVIKKNWGRLPLPPLPRSAARSAAKKKATTGPFSKLEKSQEEQVKAWLFLGEDGHVRIRCFELGRADLALTGHGRCGHQRSAALERCHEGRREGAGCLQPAQPPAGTGRGPVELALDTALQPTTD